MCIRDRAVGARRGVSCRYLEHVLQEIEEKTPQLARQQQEYQQMVDGQQRLAKLYTSVSR